MGTEGGTAEGPSGHCKNPGFTRRREAAPERGPQEERAEPCVPSHSCSGRALGLGGMGGLPERNRTPAEGPGAGMNTGAGPMCVSSRQEERNETPGQEEGSP